jgi:hypothetical protein
VGSLHRTSDYARAVPVLSLIQIQPRDKEKESKRLRAYSLFLGSGDWIRTSDLVVTLIRYFRSGVDYIITVTIVKSC